MPSESLELESSRSAALPPSDKRPHMPEPPPVRLVAVEDVHLPAPAGAEVALDSFYVGLLKFEREPTAEGEIAYKAENVRLRLQVHEPPLERDDYRQTMIEVPSLADLELKLIEREIEYERQRGLGAAQDLLVLQDPAGNWVALSEMREFR